MKSSELRAAFLNFFQSKGHTIVASSSLVPHNDPTLLFSNAGMNQFKDCFLGNEKRSYVRAATCQKCMRISGKHNDLENVGVSERHHTFFEMLGNFSFGDYFKEDAIKFAWEFVTEVLKIPKSLLWATVYEKDDESLKLWTDLTDIIPGRVLKMTAKDNFWEMGETGPCGPCSEIFVYCGDKPDKQNEAEFRNDDGTYREIWNLVFMQFDRQKDGSLVPLPKPSVDTGFGLERGASILQKTPGTYETDILRAIIAKVEKLSGFKYVSGSYGQGNLKSDIGLARNVAMRVIADHSRSIALLIADGVNPGSDGRGYVLRRLIRRAVRHAKSLEFKEPFLKHACEVVIEQMGEAYPELKERRSTILDVADAEERKFEETLDAGLNVLAREVEKLKPGQLFSGESAFLLHDTYGFPLDLTEDALKAWSTKVDTAAFERAMEEQRNRSREDRSSRAIAYTSVKIDAPKTEFLGYGAIEAEAKLAQVIAADGGTIKKGGKVSLIFDATPFYAESGGQVGDTGTIRFKDVVLKVEDTQKLQEKFFVHECQVEQGELSPKMAGQVAKLSIDANRRTLIRANHSATHLVHSALREVLGDHVKQAGSRVDDSTLRFDYSHFAQVTDDQLAAIQTLVNEQIRGNYEVSIRQMAIDEAKKLGAMALFGEKYGDVVRVVEIGPKSLELCGGTHVGRSGDIGLMMVASETGVSSGVRRIECYSGAGAHSRLLIERSELEQIAQLLKGDSSALPDKVEKALARARSLEKELEKMKSKLASAASGDLIESARTSAKGIKVISQKVEGADADTLKSMVDGLRVRLGSGVVALGSNQGDKAVIVAGVTPDLVSSISAGNIVKEITKISGGRGGGRPDFAQAGGVDPEKLSSALERVFELVQ